MEIPFNKPHLTGKETHYIYEAVNSGKISGNGMFTQKCQSFFQEEFGFRKCLLTTSCTDALEMAAILLDVGPEDEIIMPSYTFVSTANAFVLRGAKIIFADSGEDNPNINAETIEPLITPKTKAVVVVHYAGVSCDMDAIMDLSKQHSFFVVEDAAQAIDSYYKGKPLGGIGHLGAFSFHETKNIISGEGGMLVVNDERFEGRSEIIWEKGTNRAAFFRGEVNKYGWVDIGSSFLPSEVTAAFLYAQLEDISGIQNRRKQIWQNYKNKLGALTNLGYTLPEIPDFATNNAHMFYVVAPSIAERERFIHYLKEKSVKAVFHYIALHTSPYFHEKHEHARTLVQCDRYTDCLVRLPIYYDLSDQEQSYIINAINDYAVQS